MGYGLRSRQSLIEKLSWLYFGHIYPWNSCSLQKYRSNNKLAGWAQTWNRLINIVFLFPTSVKSDRSGRRQEGMFHEFNLISFNPTLAQMS